MISQDTSAYGVDLKYATGLLGRQAGQGALRRPRARAWFARRLGAAALRLSVPARRRRDPADGRGKLLPYLDVPFQHGSPRVLKLMKRPAHAENTLERIRALARRSVRSSRCAARSSSGFPGETEHDFELLLDWLRRSAARSRRLLQVLARGGRGRERLARPGARRSQAGALGSLHGVVGGDQRGEAGGQSRPAHRSVLVDTVDEHGARSRARSADAPEIDGVVRIRGRASSSPATGRAWRSPAPTPTT